MRKRVLTTTTVAAAVLVTLSALCLVGCGDRGNGQTFKTIEIAGKTWMAENLNIKTGNSWCYDDADSNCVKYGRLYDWETATAACPTGWRLPTNQEWEDLIATAGGKLTAGKKLKSTSGWNYYLDLLSGNGTDDFGFSALPGGGRSAYGHFESAGDLGYWWTATENETDEAYYRSMHHYYDNDSVHVFAAEKEVGFSVRCLRGDSGGNLSDLDSAKRMMDDDEERKKEGERIEKLSDYFIDFRDDRKYRTVTIGGETWMAENLNYETCCGSWCYDDSASNCDKYGRLYDWTAAMYYYACPPGWRLPTRQEWAELVGVNGKMGTRKAGVALKAKYGWDKIFCGAPYNRCEDSNGVDSRRNDGGGTDKYGFSALPGGFRHPNDGRFKGLIFTKEDPGKFAGIGNSVTWWTDTEYDSGNAHIMSLYNFDDRALDGINNKSSGYSVRCLLDEEMDEETYRLLRWQRWGKR